jgi:hypothetical protein
MSFAPIEDKWYELWGTFSVRDHCRRGAFIAEALLYDHLVLPVVPTADDFEREAEAKGEKVDAVKLARHEWQRWTEAGWDPARQTLLTIILKYKGRVALIPWTMDRQTEWKTKMATEFSNARRDGYFVTGSVLQQFAPAMAKTVVAVSQYHDLDELQKGEGIRQLRPHEPLKASTLIAVLGHELLLPGNPEEDNFRYLEEALDISSDPMYRERRRNLFEWQQQFVREGVTDAPSIRAAIDHMKALVNDIRTANERQERWRWAKRFFNFLGVSAKVAALGGPATVTYAAGGGALASLGAFVVDEVAPKVRVEAGMAAATLVLDAQAKLGIE